ncbi:hypothetical protein [Wolbachia endosymbiont of Cimex lectularius]|uniref:hypothetical protein n=1 Tax=Wolbachia endosymbiont of Cimex lectularius TaxID=246273 RepID=UPI000499BD56|nr:hypothetical protein [Wolbachia endosymbiont of Cimex lectularius]BAP00055.1 putative uncharacterized protein [Wolbachia endosymbiont of Cimex lectularius]
MDKETTKAMSAGCSELDVTRSVNFLGSVLLYQMNLENALVSLGFSYNTLSELDKELNQVREQNYSEKALEMYEKRFNGVFRSKYRKLSLEYRNDGKKTKNLNNMKKIMEELYETSKERDNFRYVLFSGIAFDLLYQNRKKCATLINESVVAELRNLTIWRQTDLMHYRNDFLKKAQEYLNSYRNSLCKNEQIEKDFGKLQEWYVKKYEKDWYNKLIELNSRCNSDKKLKAIKGEVDNLVKRSSEQLNILRNVVERKYEHSANVLNQMLSLTPTILKKDSSVKTKGSDLRKKAPSNISEKGQHIDEAIDRCFVSPILEYIYVTKVYKELLGGGDLTIRNSVKEFRDCVKAKRTEEFNIQSKMNNYSLKELQTKIEALRNFLFYQENLSLQEKEIEKYINNNQSRAKVILVQMLERCGKLLGEEFKEEKTWFKRVGEKIEKERKATEQANARAEQEAQRAGHINKVSKIFLRKIYSLGDELQDIVVESQDEIVDAIVQRIMECSFSPQQILDAIIEEIKSNEDQVRREGKVNAELIENVMRGFIVAVDEEQIEPNTDIEGACKSEHEEELESQKSLDDDQNSTERNKLLIITASASVGLLLGLSIAYLAGAATLTPIGAVTVFVTAAVVGTSVGYGIGKFYEKVSSKLSDVSTGHSKLELLV